MARSFIKEAGRGFPALSAGALSQGPTEAQGGGQMPRPALLAADLCRSGRADLRSRSHR